MEMLEDEECRKEEMNLNLAIIGDDNNTPPLAMALSTYMKDEHWKMNIRRCPSNLI